MVALKRWSQPKFRTRSIGNESKIECGTLEKIWMVEILLLQDSCD